MSNGDDPCYYDQYVVDTLKPSDPRRRKAEERLLFCRNSPEFKGTVVSLPLGQWNGHMNGFPVTLLFHYVDQRGFLFGFVDEASTGIFDFPSASWDEDRKRIQFTRPLPTVPNEDPQYYDGYLFTGPEGSQTPTLAGTFKRPDGSTGGWFATYVQDGIPDRMI